MLRWRGRGGTEILWKIGEVKEEGIQSGYAYRTKGLITWAKLACIKRDLCTLGKPTEIKIAIIRKPSQPG